MTDDMRDDYPDSSREWYTDGLNAEIERLEAEVAAIKAENAELQKQVDILTMEDLLRKTEVTQ